LVTGFSMVWPAYATMPPGFGKPGQLAWLAGSLSSCGEPRQREPQLVAHQGDKPSTVIRPLSKNLRQALYERHRKPSAR
jgi:hypothetical protein